VTALTPAVVVKSVEVLQDSNRRAHYDRHGTDPDDRSARAPSGPMFNGGGMRRGPAGGSFSDDISPEDLFNVRRTPRTLG